MRMTMRDFAKMKAEGRRIAMLTAYDYPSALLAERAGIPALLVGDSLGMAVLGHDTTLPVSVDDMVRHASAVMRGAKNAFVAADLPFLSYATLEAGVDSAKRLMQEAGVQAVKVEGAGPVLDVVRRLTDLGVPVIGHLGYTPQSTHQIGVRVQGRDEAGARQLIVDALALEAAGAGMIVLELVPAELAAATTQRLHIPTIGIGAGAGCDGQVQVWHDVLGLYEEKPPRHAKPFANAGAVIEAGLRAYAEEVAAGSFPGPGQSASMPAEQLAAALK